MTDSPSPATATAETDKTYTPTTNAEFLVEAFNGLQDGERPMVLHIDSPINDETDWGTGRPWAPGVNADGPAKNWFFTLSTYRAGESGYRRQKKLFWRAFGVYLDDVGTKAAPRERLDACPPTYMVETSPGNYQAGYLFTEPVDDLARVEALQDALVAAGLCDPGAKGPSARVGRLPFAVNGKYDPPARVSLVEWHPERRYTIEQLIEGLELEPVRPKGRRPKATRTARADADTGDVHIPRARENVVISALRERNLYKQPLGDGRHDITCPWVHEHTGQVDHGTAYFEPSDLYPLGGFKCQHSHGDGRRIGALLEFLGVSPADAKHKPTIRVAAGELHRVVDAAERELASDGRHYQRGGLIVNVVSDPATDETRIKPVSANALMRALSACATWERFDARAKDYVVTDPPTKHVNVLFDSERYQHLPVLHGIARQPYLRRDGTLVAGAGFDAVSGMFGVFDERAFNVPAKPARADAERALEQLQLLLAEFEFAGDHDAAAAITLMLTAAVRATLPTAPMGHVKGPVIGSGKSYLTTLIAAFAAPTRPPPLAFPSTDEECAKLLLSTLIESPPVVAFDNLTTDLVPFKSLCSALMEPALTGRVLGVSKNATVPTNTLFLSSGNNVDAVRDMTRRTLTINLEPRVETPATRTFRADPVADVHAERGRYVSLALTIIRAYVVAGQPDLKLTPINGFSDWSRFCRAPVAWLGLPDPATSIFDRMAADPEKETLGRLLCEWDKAFANAPKPIRDVVELADAGTNADLAEVVREIAEERGQINRRRFGRWVARHERRIVDGHRFTRAAGKTSCERWIVESVSSVKSGSEPRHAATVTAPETLDEEVF